ncbi:ATP-binding protein [Winogradskyella maritima]|uniref:AAA family ATPase n=1 Tax=Winogradskyella maritima TaxID=1517766 RepID=A0ABV8ANJ6_9FLAO|nr:ATP-binding protein [Winogradskyella maritima]
MNNELLNNLLEALEVTPSNIALRRQIAKLYMDSFEFSQAELHLKEILKTQDTDENKILLAKCYFEQSKFTLSEVILESLISENSPKVHLELYAKTLIRLNQNSKAREIYERIISLDPKYSDEELDSLFRLSHGANDSDFIDSDAINIIKNLGLNFADVGGMTDVKKEIDLKIIKPLLHKDLYKAYGKKIGGGILLYGPPGCGKTHIAKATAGEIDANFINVGINDILDMWLGNSEKNLHEIFESARKHKPCVVFIDEIDALGANRNDINKTAGRTVINQFLAELDGLESDNDGVLVIGATNAPWFIDPAFRRPGRFDRIIFVSPPDLDARKNIFQLQLKNKPTDSLDFVKLSKKTEKFSGADIAASVDRAIEIKLEESFKDGIPKPLTTKDVLRAISKTKPSTTEWFSSAKNYALYSNDSGLYDDILHYLKIKK